MAKSRLLSSLDAQKGRNYKQEKQKKLQKQATKKKKSKSQVSNLEEKENDQEQTNGKTYALEIESDGWESDESEAADATVVFEASTFSILERN